MSAPKVSVVLPVHNGARHVRRAIQSILGQAAQDFEFILIDDGSTDETPQILGEFEDARIVRTRFPRNHGLVAALNHGLAEARGEYIMRQDADDISLPERLGRQSEFLDRHPEVTVVGSNAIQIDEQEVENGILEMPRGLELRWHALFQNPFVHSAVMFRRDAVQRAGGYSAEPRAQYVEDYDLWLRLMWQRDILANLSEPLVKFRLNPKGVSAENEKVQGENFRRLVNTNLNRLGPEKATDAEREAIWKLQVGGGLTLTGRAADALLEQLDALVEQFADYFSLGGREKKQVAKIARSRAAKTLWHSAAMYSYEKRRREARELARRAIRLEPRLLFTGRFLRTALKNR